MPHPDPFRAPAFPQYLTHADFLAIAEANRLYDAIERARERLESELRRVAPRDVVIDELTLSEARA